MSNDSLLVVAGMLAAAAYLLVEDAAQADQPSGDSTVSGNGFAINNPGNLRYLSFNAFNGQIGNHNGYGVYDTLAHGVRAMGLQLTAYYNSGSTTVAQIVNKWAPSVENNTSAYIADVSSKMGVSSDEPLVWPGDEVSLIQAMCYHENGYNDMADSDVETYIASA